MYTLKKSLGQHFLHDEAICQRIVSAVQEFPLDNLLEVGPGGGALTKYLLQLDNIHFKAIELDEEKVAFLQKTYPQIEGKLVHASILETEKPFEDPFYIVGNFPYNISTEIIFKILEWHPAVPGMVGMFQKEVAQRLTAGEGSKTYGVTSVLAGATFDLEYLFDVPPEAFTPPPKVMSAVIRMTPKASPVPMKDERRFKMLVKAAFNQRRKTLRNALRSYFDPEVLENDIFNKRAEQLSIVDFGKLSFEMR